MYSSLLWLQLAYSTWQFIRVAKFLRIPSALCYHTFMWLINKAGRPFSKEKFCLIVQGQKWTYPTNAVLQSGDSYLGAGHYSQERMGVTYVTDAETVRYTHLLDRSQAKFLCSNVDLILPDLYIADVYTWSDGVDMFMKEGAAMNKFQSPVLIMSSRDHFLNQNFMRLLAILPLMLQARGFNYVSAYASIAIILLDQLSYPANLVWRAFQDLLVYLGRDLISRIRKLKTRQFVSTFLSTITPKFSFSDQIVRNFYFVKKDEAVLLFGTSCIDHLYDIVEHEAPSALNPYKQLSQEDYDSLGKVQGNLEHFSITVGAQHVEHHVSGACIKTFFQPGNQDAYYSFIDNEHLHFGVCTEDEAILNARKALKWIEAHGRMPVSCNGRGELHAVRFNRFVDTVAAGRGVLIAKVKKGTWVG